MSSYEEQIIDTPIKESILSPTPPSGAESLFFSGLDTSSIDASTLSEQLQHNNNTRTNRHHQQQQRNVHSSSITRGSVGLDDFLSCIENADDSETDDSFDTCTGTHENLSSFNNSSNSPIITHSPYSMETIDNNSNSNNSKIIMATKTKKSKSTTTSIKKAFPADTPVAAPTKTATTATPPVVDGDQMKVDAAEIVYGKAKDILAWGKTVPLVKFFVGTSEAVAGKALEVVGTDLSTVDGRIGSELSKFDGSILNPAISAIAKVLMNVAGKSEETFMPIIIAMLSPLGMMKSKANEQTPEAHVETPEVTAVN
jgi:hypothetical protein